MGMQLVVVLPLPPRTACRILLRKTGSVKIFYSLIFFRLRMGKNLMVMAHFTHFFNFPVFAFFYMPGQQFEGAKIIFFACSSLFFPVVQKVLIISNDKIMFI